METPTIAEQQRARAVAEDYRRRGYDVVEEAFARESARFLGWLPARLDCSPRRRKCCSRGEVQEIASGRAASPRIGAFASGERALELRAGGCTGGKTGSS